MRACAYTNRHTQIHSGLLRAGAVVCHWPLVHMGSDKPLRGGLAAVLGL